MKAARSDLFAYLDQLGIKTTTVDHPPVFTVEESEALIDRLPGGHTKNLFLKDAKGRLFLLVAEARADVPMKKLHKMIGCARLSFGKPDLLEEKLGISPGSVTAFAAMNDTNGDVVVYIDQTLLAHDVINCHPLENSATTAIARDDLIAFLEATGHPPTPIDLTAIPTTD
ncbi:MAG: prolyl-tRNA synthetase associated domain-containing protein [Pseudomonadota bacterium]